MLFLFNYSDAQKQFSLRDLSFLEKCFILYMSMIQLTMLFMTFLGTLNQLKLIFLGSLYKFRLLQKSPEDYSVLCQKNDNSKNEVNLFIINLIFSK